jgi:hypothetical protein
MLTVSKALEMSMATAAVLLVGLLQLKPLLIWLMRGSSAVIVERCWRKPCWVGKAGKAEVIKGSSSLSRIFTAGQRREMDLNEAP